jgi:hypothetical protein
LRTHQKQLISAILKQLSGYGCKEFRDLFGKKHTDYLLGEKSFSIDDLFTSAKKMVTIYKCQGIWKNLEDDEDSPELLAIKAVVKHCEAQDKVNALFSAQLKQRTSTGKQVEKETGKRVRFARQAPPFMNDKPDDLSETKEWKSRTWWFCTECGKWSTSHGDKHPKRQHEANYRHPTKTSGKQTRGQPPNKKSKIDKAVDTAKASLSLVPFVMKFHKKEGGEPET